MAKQASKPEVIKPESGTVSAKKPPKPAEVQAIPAVDNVSVLDKFNSATQALRQQIKAGEAVVLPSMIVQLLPAGMEKGDRKKVMEWRTFVVWAEWSGSEWAGVVERTSAALEYKANGKAIYSRAKGGKWQWVQVAPSAEKAKARAAMLNGEVDGTG